MTFETIYLFSLVRTPFGLAGGAWIGYFCDRLIGNQWRADGGLGCGLLLGEASSAKIAIAEKSRDSYSCRARATTVDVSHAGSRVTGRNGKRPKRS